jgi:hypothetical protein
MAATKRVINNWIFLHNQKSYEKLHREKVEENFYSLLAMMKFFPKREVGRAW